MELHFIVAIVLCLAMLCYQCDARYFKTKVLIWPYSENAIQNEIMNRGFGFLPNGHLIFHLSCPVNREFTRISQEDFREVCEKLHIAQSKSNTRQSQGYCPHYKLNPLRPINRTHDVVHATSFTWRFRFPVFYTMLLLQCPVRNENVNDTKLYIPSSCEAIVEAMNENGAHLSSDEVSLPLLYVVITFMWAGMIIIWFFNWVIYFKFSNCLHKLISVLFVCKVMLVTVTYFWWKEVAATGQEQLDLTSVLLLMQCVEDALLFITMMLISEGWGVIRTRLKHYRWSSLFLLAAVFSGSLICVHWVHPYFLAMSVSCLVFMLYKTLKWLSYNIDLLRRRRRRMRRFIHRHNLRYRGPITLDQQLMLKLQLYKRFRVACASFSLVYAISATLASFLYEFAYVRALTFEIPELFLLRLRNFEVFEHIELVPPRENIATIELPDVCGDLIAPHVMLGEPLHTMVEKETQTPRRRRWQLIY